MRMVLFVKKVEKSENSLLNINKINKYKNIISTVLSSINYFILTDRVNSILNLYFKLYFQINFKYLNLKFFKYCILNKNSILNCNQHNSLSTVFTLTLQALRLPYRSRMPCSQKTYPVYSESFMVLCVFSAIRVRSFILL